MPLQPWFTDDEVAESLSRIPERLGSSSQHARGTRRFWRRPSRPMDTWACTTIRSTRQLLTC